MNGLEHVPALIIGATFTLAGLMILLIALWLTALVVRRIEESNAVSSTKALRTLSEDEDTV